MSAFTKEIDNLKNHGLEWSKVKEILKGVLDPLQQLADLLPIGILKTVLEAVLTGLTLLLKLLPLSK